MVMCLLAGFLQDMLKTSEDKANKTINADTFSFATLTANAPATVGMIKL